MKVALSLVPLLLAAHAHAGLGSPCQPSGIDVGRRLANGAYLAAYPMSSGYPHVTSNDERDCMEWKALYFVVALATTAGDLAPNALSDAIDALNLVFTRLSVVDPYEGSLQKPGGATWPINVFGRHYQEEQGAFDSFRYELTSSSHRAAAVARFASQSILRDVLDVGPGFDPKSAAPFTLPALPPSDSTRFQSVLLDTRTKLPACGNGDCSALAAVHAAHRCSSEAHCGVIPPSPCPSAQLAHLTYELGCAGNEKCLAFRRVKPFSGRFDPRWTPTQQCQLARLQDAEHLAWMQAQQQGDWAASRQHDTVHLEFHVGANLADPRLRFIIMCRIVGAGADPPHGTISDFHDFGLCYGGKQNMQTLLPKLVAAYGIR